MENKEKDELIELSDFQADPGSARGRDFQVMSPAEGRELAQPAHGQCGDTDAEYDRLVAEAEGTSKGPFRDNLPRPVKNVSQGSGRPTKAVQQK